MTLSRTRVPRADWRAAMARRRELRVARGVVVGLFALVLSLAGHGLAGGHAPPTASLIVAAFLGLGGIVMAGRPLRLLPLFALLVGAQAVTHVLLGLGHVVPAAGPGGATAAPDWAAVTAMTTAHVGAAAALAALLYLGEDLVWRWAALVGTALGVRLPAAEAVPAAPPIPVRRPADGRRLLSTRVPLAARRGPPVAAAR